jgi:anti-anti-sigma factor
MSASSPIVDGAAQHCPVCGGEIRAELLDSGGNALCPRCRNLLWFVCRKTEGIAVVTLLPEWVLGNESTHCADEILAAAGGAPRLIVDLSHIPVVTSMVLAVLLILHRRLAATNGAIKICGLTGTTEEVFHVTKLDTILDLYADEKAARQSRWPCEEQP